VLFSGDVDSGFDYEGVCIICPEAIIKGSTTSGRSQNSESDDDLIKHKLLKRQSVNVNNYSPSQDHTHPDDHIQSTFDLAPGFKPFTISKGVLPKINE